MNGTIFFFPWTREAGEEEDFLPHFSPTSLPAFAKKDTYHGHPLAYFPSVEGMVEGRQHNRRLPLFFSYKNRGRGEKKKRPREREEKRRERQREESRREREEKRQREGREETERGKREEKRRGAEQREQNRRRRRRRRSRQESTTAEREREENSTADHREPPVPPLPPLPHQLLPASPPLQVTFSLSLSFFTSTSFACR